MGRLKASAPRVASAAGRISAAPNDRMGRKSARQRGYDSRWDKARKTFLASRPWCVMCAQQERRTPATDVDHIKPHRGDQALFWDRANWQPLCAPHHRSTKQRMEHRGGSAIGCDVHGNPIDQRHPGHRR